MAKILFDIGHPAHVHLFRNAARELKSQGDEVLFTVLDREVILDLVNYYDLPYRITYHRRKGRLNMARELPQRTYTTWRIARAFQPDILVSMGNPTVGVPARLLRKPYLAMTDTEHASNQHALFKPVATVIATPEVFTKDFGSKQLRYNSFHELAYLHPDEFTPDENMIQSLGLEAGQPFFLLRFVAWEATHDIGQSGFRAEEKTALIQKLAERGTVFLSVESGQIPAEFQQYVRTFPPDKIHHLLAFAMMYVGEGGTIASEAAVLGTPSVYVNTLRMGYLEELERRGLLFMYADGASAMSKIDELLAMPDLKSVWAERRQVLLQDFAPLTPWLVNQIQTMLAQSTGKTSQESG